MDQFLARLPKSVLAFGAIVLGFFFIVFNDPPKTVCDAQLELFREAQKEFLAPRKGVKSESRPPLVKELYEACRGDNSPGGCFEYFNRLKKLTVDFANIPAQCMEAAAQDASVREWMPKSLKLMVQIAWGDRGPASVFRKHGWFDSSDLALFCSLDRSAQRMFGREPYLEWREKILLELPQAGAPLREQSSSLVQRSLFSVACRDFR